MQNHIFRRSDIRGIVGIDLSIQDTYRLTQAAVSWFAQKCLNLQRIAVAFDGRLHGQEMYEQVAQAIVDAGYQVYFLGVCPTPVFVYGLYQLPVQAGIMITGSGTASEFNGFKLYAHQNLVQGDDLQDVYQHFQTNKSLLCPIQGKIIPCPIMEQYIDGVWHEFAHLSQYDFSMVIDCGNGATGPIMKTLIHKMGWIKVQVICDSVDGSFPMHDPEPFDQKNMMLLQSEIKKNTKSFGVAFDGDGDRMLMCDFDGTIVLGDQLLAIFARDILSKHAHRSVVHDMSNLLGLEHVITQVHGKSVFVDSQVHSISMMMKEQHAILAGQLHGRFFFKDRHVGYADGIYAFLRLLDILVKERKSFHDLVISLPSMISVPEYAPVTSIETVKEL